MSRRKNRVKPESLIFVETGKTHQRKQLKRVMLWLGVIVLTLSTVAVGTHFAVQQLMRKLIYENPRYALREVQVEVKGSIPKKQVLQAARLRAGVNVMSLNLKQIQNDIEKLPYVGEAQVMRLLPDRILLRVVERVPIARISSLRTDLNMRELLYLDRNGTVIKPLTNEPIRDLPEILGASLTDIEPGQRIDLPEVLGALELLKQLELTPLKAVLDVHHFRILRPLSVSMVTQDGAQITFRLDRVPQQLDRLREVLDFASARNRQLATLDLTPEQNVPATFRN